MPRLLHNPDIPHLSPFEEDWGPGKMLRIQGCTPNYATRFNINIQCGQNVSPRDDLALHLSVRLEEGYIARNTLIKQQWGEEQGEGYMPIAPGQQFEIIILCEQNAYKLAINGKHFCEFPHRIPYHRVTHLAIDGDVEIALINHENLPSPPAAQQSPAQAPPNYGGPPMYGPPGGQYGGSDQMGHGQYGPQAPPGYDQNADKSSGFEDFLGQAGAAIVGAIGSRAMQGGGLQGALGALTGSNTQNQPQQQPQNNPQQPFPGGYGGQSVGGLGSIGSILTNVLAESTKSNQPQQQQHNAQQPYGGGYGEQNQGGLAGIGSLLSNVLSDSTRPAQPQTQQNNPQQPYGGGYGGQNQGGLGNLGSILTNALAESFANPSHQQKK